MPIGHILRDSKESRLPFKLRRFMSCSTLLGAIALSGGGRGTTGPFPPPPTAGSTAGRIRSPPPPPDGIAAAHGYSLSTVRSPSPPVLTPNNNASQTCRPYENSCGGICTDMVVDPHHCGRCGHACARSQRCAVGRCVPASMPDGEPTRPAQESSCGEGSTDCGTGCVDLRSSAQNCGRCGNPCSRGQACTRAICH
jgi:hypothetical protein